MRITYFLKWLYIDKNARKVPKKYKKLANEIGEALNRQRFSYTARITTNY